MLRLLWQELLFRRNGVIGWGLGLCFFPIVYIGIYPSVAEEMAGLADLEIYQAMGVSLGTFEDWVGSILLVFVPLLVAIYALINGTGTLAGEEEDGRLEMIVTLPLPRWQIVTVKALALSVATLIILLIVALVSAIVFAAIENQVETQVVGFDLTVALIYTWPLVFAMGMISMFLAAFCSSRRIAAMIATAILIISYFGSNLANTVSAVETFEPLFLFSYLDSTANALANGQKTSDLLTLIGVSLVAFILAVFFFQRRDITVGAWPWQRGKIPAGTWAGE